MSDTPDTRPPEPVTPAETPGGVIGGPVVSLGDAVRTTGVARSTLQRRLRDGAIPGATRTPNGGWSIPIAGLIAAGIAPTHTPPDPTPPAPLVEPSTPATSSALAELQHALDLERAARLQAETVAAERGRALDDLRAALDALSRALPAPAVAPAEPRRRWWNRQG